MMSLEFSCRICSDFLRLKKSYITYSTYGNVLRKLFVLVLFCFVLGFFRDKSKEYTSVYKNRLSYFVPDEPLCIDCISSEYMYRLKSVLFSCSMVSEFPRCLLSSTRSSNWFIMPNVKM